MSISNSLTLAYLLKHAPLDYHAVARYFGEGATYSAIENRLRPIRKAAQQLRTDVDGAGTQTLSGTGVVKKRGRKPAGKNQQYPSILRCIVLTPCTSGDGGQGSNPTKVGNSVIKLEDSDEDITMSKKKKDSSNVNDVVLNGRVSKSTSKSKSKSITPKANGLKRPATKEGAKYDILLSNDLNVGEEPTVSEKLATNGKRVNGAPMDSQESKVKSNFPDEILSEEERMIMEKDSTDEAFSLSEFDDAVEELGGFDGMMDF